MTGIGFYAPAPGVRLGMRLRLARHVTIAALAMYELETLSEFTRGAWVPRPAHLVHGVLRVEAFDVSAFERVLVPEFTVGLFLGAGAAIDGALVLPSFLSGLHLGLCRMRPSGWWFPVFIEVGTEVFSVDLDGKPYVIEALWRLTVGVGL